MAKQKKEKSKYKIVFYDETTLREVASLSVTTLNVVAYAGVLLVVVMCIVLVVLVYTPLNKMLPRDENNKYRDELVASSLQLDSIKTVLAQRNEYFSSIHNIMTGNPEANDAFAADSAYKPQKINYDYPSQQKHDSLMRRIIEMEERETSAVINETDKKEKNKTFFNPIRGMVTSRFDAGSGHLGIDIAAKEGEPVLATYPGTVVLATWSSETGNVIQIQHIDNFISIYKHNSALLKKVGDKVSAGEPIAIVGNSGEFTSGTHLHFELWHNGVPVDPEKYIIE